jgi:hypothetical protein
MARPQKADVRDEATGETQLDSLFSASPRVAVSACARLWHDPSALRLVASELVAKASEPDFDPGDVERAGRLLGRLGHEAVPMLHELLGVDSPTARAVAFYAVRECGVVTDTIAREAIRDITNRSRFGAGEALVAAGSGAWPYVRAELGRNIELDTAALGEYFDSLQWDNLADVTWKLLDVRDPRSVHAMAAACEMKEMPPWLLADVARNLSAGTDVQVGLLLRAVERMGASRGAEASEVLAARCERLDPYRVDIVNLVRLLWPYEHAKEALRRCVAMLLAHPDVEVRAQGAIAVCMIDSNGEEYRRQLDDLVESSDLSARRAGALAWCVLGRDEPLRTILAEALTAGDWVAVEWIASAASSVMERVPPSIVRVVADAVCDDDVLARNKAMGFWLAAVVALGEGESCALVERMLVHDGEEVVEFGAECAWRMGEGARDCAGALATAIVGRSPGSRAAVELERAISRVAALEPKLQGLVVELACDARRSLWPVRALAQCQLSVRQRQEVMGACEQMLKTGETAATTRALLAFVGLGEVTANALPLVIETLGRGEKIQECLAVVDGVAGMRPEDAAKIRVWVAHWDPEIRALAWSVLWHCGEVTERELYGERCWEVRRALAYALQAARSADREVLVRLATRDGHVGVREAAVSSLCRGGVAEATDRVGLLVASGMLDERTRAVAERALGR